MNRVTLCGHLGADPELRQTSKGTSVCNMRIATNSRVKDPDGEWTDHTEWHNVVAWSGQADSCAQYLTKGRQVLIEGRLQTRPWTDRDGNERQKTEVVADRVHFVGGRGDAGRGDAGRGDDNRQGNRQQVRHRGGYGGHGDAEPPF